MNKGAVLLLMMLVALSLSEAFLVRFGRRRRRRTVIKYYYPPHYPHYPHYAWVGKRDISELDSNSDGVLDVSELTNAGFDQRDVDELKQFLDLNSESPYKVEDLDE